MLLERVFLTAVWGGNENNLDVTEFIKGKQISRKHAHLSCGETKVDLLLSANNHIL